MTANDPRRGEVWLVQLDPKRGEQAPTYTRFLQRQRT